MSEPQTVKASNCVFSAELEIKETGDEERKTAPFSAVARTGDALSHHYWGRVVHDLDGIKRKSRIPLDYNHDTNRIVGYANKFNTDSGDLEIRGALTPSKHEKDQFTQEIIDKSREGVPYEASINFAGAMDVEKIDEGDQVTVNGREFSGPITVIRKWHLRGVAITPYGYDSGTSTQFSSDDSVQVNYVTRNEEDNEMSEETKLSTAEEEVKDVLGDVTTEPVDADLDSSAEASENQEAVNTENTEAMSQEFSAQDYYEAFGKARGAVYFADGLSMQAAMLEEFKRLQSENKELKNKIAGNDDGLEEALEFSAEELPEDKKLLDKIPAQVAMSDVVEAKDYRFFGGDK